jgi:medium-chain acyl-[acyl-carrier-protein] hydrolase
MRLICFPYAGGSAAIYRQLPRLLPEIEVRAIELPGRGSRLREKAHDSMERLVETLLHELRGTFDEPFAFLGHSMGASIAFELACRLPERARVNLQHLFFSARAAPGMPRRTRALHELDDAAFKQGLRELNGTRQSILDHDEVMNLMMPALRADFTLIERYSPSMDRCIPVNITAFAGTQDTAVTVESVAAWKQATAREFDLILIEGGHFYLEKALPILADAMASRLGALC